MNGRLVHAALLAGAALFALLAATGTHAAKVFRWKDEKGVVHYGDRPPASARPEQISRIPVRAEPGAIARLRVEGDGQQYLAYADNALAGPIEVMLDAGNSSVVVGDPPLPARATGPPRGSTLVARIGSAQPSRGGEFQLQLRSVPGDPNARPRDVEYAYPLKTGSLHVAQGFGGGFSHNDAQNRHAVDLAAPIGTTVLAAREGVVMQVESDFDKASLNREQYGGRANFVRVLHDDGTMGLYAHLKPEGVLVRVGQRVRRGQTIGLSGNTGFSGGPHLHFVVQVNRGMKLESIPFKMFGPHGILRLTMPRAPESP
jgi:murein DD-endopeptidase MepM/ murein hydrolase activator NlpD